MNISQVRVKIIDVYVSNNGIITYDVIPQNGAILLEQSEYLMMKSSTGIRTRQILINTTNLNSLEENRMHQ